MISKYSKYLKQQKKESTELSTIIDDTIYCADDSVWKISKNGNFSKISWAQEAKKMRKKIKEKEKGEMYEE